MARTPFHVGQPVVETDIVMPGSRGFLAAAKSRDCAIELNTAGLRKECPEIYPNRQLLAPPHQN